MLLRMATLKVRSVHDFVSTSLLTAGLLFFFLVSVELSFAASKFLDTVSQRTPLLLPIQKTVPDAQIQSLLALLQHLPQVTTLSYQTKEQMFDRLQRERPEEAVFLQAYVPENPLLDHVVVGVRSLRDFAAFQKFLETPSLQSILAPTFPWTLRAWEGEVHVATARLRGLRTFLVGSAFLSVLLLCILLSRAARVIADVTRDERTLRLILGAAAHAVRAPALLGMGVVIAPALLLAGIVAWGLSHSLHVLLFGS